MSSKPDKRLRRKVRNSYIISTISIAMVLFLMGSVAYLIINATNAANSMRSSFTINVMLKDNLEQGVKDTVGVRLQANPAISEAKYVSKEQAAKNFKEYIGSDFEEFLEFNPLPDAYEVKLNRQSSDIGSVKALERELSTWNEVSEVVYQRSIVESISSDISKFNMMLLIFGAIFFFIAIVLLNNTLRLTIYSKRYLINTMKLVGASKWFIIKPFVGRSILGGIYAWLIAGAMIFGMIWAFGEKLPKTLLFVGNQSIYFILGGMLITGVLISMLFTIFAVNKFINMHSSKIHLY